MIKYIPTIAILITLTGCKEVKLNTVSYLYAKCESSGNVGIKLDKDGVYRCIKPRNKVKSFLSFKEPKKKKKIVSSKRDIRKTVSSGCETTITQHYYSKSGGLIKTCHGKLLEIGQKTRIKIVRE